MNEAKLVLAFRIMEFLKHKLDINSFTLPYNPYHFVEEYIEDVPEQISSDVVETSTIIYMGILHAKINLDNTPKKLGFFNFLRRK